jgi:hypothetical protein
MSKRFDPGLKCIYCNSLLNLNEIDNDVDPIEPDTICVCNCCGEIMLFDDMLIIRKPSPEELVYILKEQPELDRVQRMILSKHVQQRRWYD